MKYFIVMVLIRIGTYEKSCTKLVRGNTQVEAENNALLGECHGSIGEEAEYRDNGIYDMYDEFHYSIQGTTKEVEPEHVELIYNYFK